MPFGQACELRTGKHTYAHKHGVEMFLSSWHIGIKDRKWAGCLQEEIVTLLYICVCFWDI